MLKIPNTHKFLSLKKGEKNKRKFLEKFTDIFERQKF